MRNNPVIPASVPASSIDPFFAAWALQFAPPDRRPIYHWAHDFVRLPTGVYTQTGAFDVGTSRYLIPIFDALKRDHVRAVIFRAPVRFGKTLVADIWVPWIIRNSPGPIMWNLNTDPLARRHVRTRVMPVLRNVKGMDAYIPDKFRPQEIIFLNGVPLYVQGPSITNLQGVGIRYLIEDELWMREPGKHAEALARLGDYERLGTDKTLIISQGGIEGDDLDEAYSAGTCEEWHVPCLHCGHYFYPLTLGYRPDGTKWGLIYDDIRSPAGDLIINRILPHIRYQCPDCDRPHTLAEEAKTKAHWNERGRYVQTNPEGDPNRPSYTVTSWVARDWRKMAKEYLVAQNQKRIGNIDPLRIFTQKREARTWVELMANDDAGGPTYEPCKDWPEEIARFMSVDFQIEGIKWGMIGAFGGNNADPEFRLLWFGKLYSEEDIEKRATEFKIPPNRVMLDGSFDTKIVYAMAVRHGWIVLKGSAELAFNHSLKLKNGKRKTVERSYSKPRHGDPEVGKVYQGRRFAVVIYWSNPSIKARLKRLIQRGKWIHLRYPPGDPIGKELKTQMAGAWFIKKRDQVTGRVRIIWRDNGNDHAYDCASMIVTAATILKILPDLPGAEGDQPKDEEPDEETWRDNEALGANGVRAEKRHRP
jgi:hypothetical protein